MDASRATLALGGSTPLSPIVYRLTSKLERKTRIELATSSLARRRSTAELLPLSKAQYRRWQARDKDAGAALESSVTEQGCVAQRDDILGVLAPPTRVRDSGVVFAEPSMQLEVLFLKPQPPAVFFFEQLGVNFIKAARHVVVIDLRFFLPIPGQVVDRFFQVAAALFEEDRHHADLVHALAIDAVESRARLANHDEFARVAVGLVHAVFAALGELGRFGAARVAHDHLIAERAAGLAGHFLGEDVVDGLIPVQLHQCPPRW